MAEILGKVTVFIMRPSPRGDELLLFEHPHAGIQIPAGTMEPGEPPAQAALREANEETGLAELTISRFLGEHEYRCLPDERYMLRRSTVYSRPDPASFDWAVLPRAAYVKLHRRVAGFSQVSYQETDRYPDPTYISYQITGWVADDALTDVQRRHFYLLACHQKTTARWTVSTDNHIFTLFWAPLAALPEIVAPQQAWLEYLPR